MENHVTKEQVVELFKTLFAQVKDESLLSLLQSKVFVMHYRAKFRPDSAIIIAKDIKDARERAFNYCKRFQMRFISVQPFFLDLDKNPDGEQHSVTSLVEKGI